MMPLSHLSQLPAHPLWRVEAGQPQSSGATGTLCPELLVLGQRSMRSSSSSGYTGGRRTLSGAYRREIERFLAFVTKPMMVVMLTDVQPLADSLEHLAPSSRGRGWPR